MRVCICTMQRAFRLESPLSPLGLTYKLYPDTNAGVKYVYAARVSSRVATSPLGLTDRLTYIEVRTYTSAGMYMQRAFRLESPDNSPKRTTYRTDKQATQDPTNTNHKWTSEPKPQRPTTRDPSKQPQHPRPPHGTPPQGASSLPELDTPLPTPHHPPPSPTSSSHDRRGMASRQPSTLEWKASLSASRAMALRASRRSCQSSASAHVRSPNPPRGQPTARHQVLSACGRKLRCPQGPPLFPGIHRA